jgi:hypothetical protein
VVGAAVIALMGLLVWIAKHDAPKIVPETGARLIRNYALVRGFAHLVAFGIPTALTVVLLVPAGSRGGFAVAIAACAVFSVIAAVGCGNLPVVFCLLLVFGIAPALALLLPEYAADWEGVVIAVVYGFFAVVAAVLVWDTQRFALLVTAEGLDCRSAWRRRRFLSWADVESVSVGGIAKAKGGTCLVIRAGDGWEFTVPYTASGQGLLDFAMRCRQNLSPKQLEGAKSAYWLFCQPPPESNEEDV